MTCSYTKTPNYPDKPGLDLIAWPFRVEYLKKSAFINTKASSHFSQIFWPSSTHAIQHLGSVIWICAFRLCQHVVGRNEGVFVCFFPFLFFSSSFFLGRCFYRAGEEGTRDSRQWSHSWPACEPQPSNSEGRRVCLKNTHTCWSAAVERWWI